MIWDSTSQAFVEAQTPMVYDTENQAWRETTGMAWNEQSQAWTKRWNSGAYVYGAASETITIKKNGIIVATVDTDSTGQSIERITLSNGTYTLTGSVSGWTEEQTIDKNTDRFRAMPEGALYWYGNECIDVTGGWEAHNPSSVDSRNFFYTQLKIDGNGYTQIKAIGNGNGSRTSVGCLGAYTILPSSKGTCSVNIPSNPSATDATFAVSNTNAVKTYNKNTNNLYLYTADASTSAYFTGYLYAMWLE